MHALGLTSLKEEKSCSFTFAELDFPRAWKAYYDYLDSKTHQAFIKDSDLEHEIVRCNHSISTIKNLPPLGNQWMIPEGKWLYSVGTNDELQKELTGVFETSWFKLSFNLDGILQLHSYEGYKEDILCGLYDLLQSMCKK